MRYIIFENITSNKEDEHKMRAYWTTSFEEVEKAMKRDTYVGFVPESKFCTK